MSGRVYPGSKMRLRTLIPVAIVVALFAVLLAAASAPAERTSTADGPQVRDVVLNGPPSATARRKVARAGGARYPVGDAKGRTVLIEVTLLCQSDPIGCPDSNPGAIATFLGSLVHRGEISSLWVLVAHPDEMVSVCGDASALACYYSDRNQMVIPGRDFLASDGANRAFVIAHEYGHHIANHRRNPPFVPTLSYGTKRWGTYERVCPGTRAGLYFPGNQSLPRYYKNPGEAFAEAYAFSHFPAGMVEWNWDPSLRPDENAYAAIRTDVRRPWRRRNRILHTGSIGSSRHVVTRRIATPLDGDVSLILRGEPGAHLDLIVRSARGRLLATAAHFGARERVRIQVCGQRALRVTIRRPARRQGGDFRLVAFRP